MINKFYPVLIIILASSWLAAIAWGETFECAFIQEKYSAGKSNAASCSMLPEKTFSTARYSPKKNEHCQVEPVYRFEDLTEVIVDTSAKRVTWIRHSGLINEAKPLQKPYYLQEGFTEKEAEEKIQREHTTGQSFDIITHYKSYTDIHIDPVTGKLLKPPKEVPEHNLILSNNVYLYYLYIPEASGDAILLEPTGMSDSSWVRIRFGRCRKIK